MPQDLIPEYKRDESEDYLKVLNAIKEIPFSVGKNLLLDFLKGNIKNKSITNNNLDELDNFDCLEDYNKEEVKELIDSLFERKFIEIVSGDTNPFMKMIKLTDKGIKELKNPKLNNFKNSPVNKKTIITEKDKKNFNELDKFLNGFNDCQKKAIISSNEKILCVAGAGSGKTACLTKKIEFLVKYKGINPEKILAITFTRKARQEMTDRLTKFGVWAQVETFNSFSEKILQKYQNKIYNRQMKVLSYGNKVMAVMSALDNFGLKMNEAIDKYFSDYQKKNKTPEQLSNIFMNDCFSILDYFKSKNQELYDFSIDAKPENVSSAKIIYNICKYLKDYMNLHGLRDYTDQILDTIKFFKINMDLIPKFDYILVDEYQDVNAMQIELLDLLNSKNLFVVGDPRQAIFGWRGSDINFILKFTEKFPEAEIITLTKNYRSNKHLVDFINFAIKDMNLPDIESNFLGLKEIKLLNFEKESDEFNFIIDEILKSNVEKNEIFVLARTNRQILDFSRLMKEKQIKHVLKTEDINNGTTATKDELTLATIHSIKGLEAKMVFLIGANEQNFPCKASDHPIIELFKVEEYDKEEEEKRLFYVAISRAKHKLVITFSGKRPTYFINQDMLNLINSKDSQKKLEMK